MPIVDGGIGVALLLSAGVLITAVGVGDGGSVTIVCCGGVGNGVGDTGFGVGGEVTGATITFGV